MLSLAVPKPSNTTQWHSDVQDVSEEFQLPVLLRKFGIWPFVVGVTDVDGWEGLWGVSNDLCTEL